jgi:hypothetical protein
MQAVKTTLRISVNECFWSNLLLFNSNKIH